MPHTKSAAKRMITSNQSRIKSRKVRSAIKDQRKALLDAVAAKDQPTSETALRQFNSLLDKAVKGGVIKKNNAIRRKTRASAFLRKSAAAAKPA